MRDLMGMVLSPDWLMGVQQMACNDIEMLDYLGVARFSHRNQGKHKRMSAALIAMQAQCHLFD
jgi:hypothetical protein